MASRQPADEAQIRQRIERLLTAIRAMDLEGLKGIYAPGIVSFDIEPPLRHVGAEAKWKNWEKVFTLYQAPLGYEIRDFTLAVGGDVAFGHSLARLSGTMKNGRRTGYWVRWTIGLRKVDGDWKISGLTMTYTDERGDRGMAARAAERARTRN